MQFEKWYDVDLLKPRPFVPDLGFPTFEGDNNSVRIGVNLFKNKTVEAATGTIKGYCILPNGVALVPFDGAKDGNKAWIDLPDNALVMDGRITVSIRCFDANETTVLFQASATVRRVDATSHYDPDDEIGDITDLIEEAEQAAQDAAQAAQDAQAALAQASNIVSYEEQTGQTDAEKAQARENISAASEDDVSDLKGAINDLEDASSLQNELLDTRNYTNSTNTDVTNNNDGTYTFGTADNGSTFWKTMEEVPAGTYSMVGSPYGFTVVSKGQQYSGDNVLVTNDTGAIVTFTNPTKQYLYFGIRTNYKPPESFTLAPSIIDTVSKFDVHDEELNELNAFKRECEAKNELLNVLNYTSNNNAATTNNNDGTYTFGTTDNGTTFWKSKEEIPAGKYYMVGAPYGFTVVSKAQQYTGDDVIKTNDTGETVIFTNPIQQYLYFGIRTNSSPSASFTFAPSVYNFITRFDDYDKELEELSEHVDEEVEEINDEIHGIVNKYDEQLGNEPYNIYTPDLSQSGKEYTSSGELENHPTWSITEAIPVEPSTCYYFKDFTDGTRSFEVVEFDSQMDFIELLTGINNEREGFYTSLEAAYVMVQSITAAVTDHEILLCKQKLIARQALLNDSVLYEKPGTKTYQKNDREDGIEYYNAGLVYADNVNRSANVVRKIDPKLCLTKTFDISNHEKGAAIYCYIPRPEGSEGVRAPYHAYYRNGTMEYWSNLRTETNFTVDDDVVKVRFTFEIEYMDECAVYLTGFGFLYCGKNFLYKESYKYGISSDLLPVYHQSVSAMETEKGNNYDVISLIATTDQHGRYRTYWHNRVMKWINDNVDINNVSAIINLGDTVMDHYDESATCLPDYKKMMIESGIPKDKVIDVVGNHDVYYTMSGTTGNVHMPYKAIAPYFRNPNADIDAKTGCFVTYDRENSIKYVSFNIFSTRYKTEGVDSGYIMDARLSEWLIKELEKDDGFDVVYLSHIPVITTVDGNYRESGSYTPYNENFMPNAALEEDFINLLKARYNKMSGSFTDSNGVAHAYDFTGLSGDLLIALHGHTHVEFYKHLWTGGLLEFAFDWFDGNTTYFCTIDRGERKFKVWKTEVDVPELVLDI